MVSKIRSFAIACLLLGIGAASAGGGALPSATPDAPPAADGAQRADAAVAASTWRVWGGTVGFRFNRSLLRQLGFTLEDGRGAASDGPYTLYRVADRQGLEFVAPLGTFERFSAGRLEALGGFRIARGAERVDLRDFAFRPNAENPLWLDLVDADGVAWFYVDHLMYRLDAGDARLDVPTMDLRIGRRLAERVGLPRLAGRYVADVRLTTNVVQRGKSAPGPDSCASPNWPGSAANGYQADVFMTNISFEMMRCRQAGSPGLGCNGPGGDDGEVVFAPNSSLQNSTDNNVNGTQGPCTAANPCAAEVSWNTMFSPPRPPYGNDQHPFLIWNLYRINGQGQLENIARSGVKHAFLTINFGCSEPCGNSQILGRGCGDTYSTGNNDSAFDLGPRSEIIPDQGKWGRCGSIFDVDCDGSQDGPTATGDYDRRMIVRESQIDPGVNAGAQYFAESWYVVRDDVDIYSTMGHLIVTPTWQAAFSSWDIPATTATTAGPVINRWVNPAAPGPNASNNELDAPEGHVRVAAKVTSLGGGQFRYDYAVMNFDFARATTQGAEPNLRVLSNRGFSAFRVTANASVSAITFSDGDSSAANNWTGVASPGEVTWSGPVGATLDWGSLYLFSFVANAPPQSAPVTLTVADPGTPTTYQVSAFAAAEGATFANGFENP